jgi:hypothetical protein
MYPLLVHDLVEMGWDPALSNWIMLPGTGRHGRC